MCSRRFLLVIVIYMAIMTIITYGEVTFYNLQCKTIDKSYGDFEFCYIKAINRSLKYASAKFKVRRIITQGSATWTLYKRANGWKPFLYNVTFDFCKLLKTANKNPVVNHFFNTFKQYSNLNHSCPYNHDIEVINVPTTIVNTYWTQTLPMPTGEYLLHSQISTQRKLGVEVRFYVRIF